MQSRDWPGTFRNLGAVAAQMYGVAQAGPLHSFRNRVAIPLLVLPGFRRWQQQVGRACTTEGFSERSRVANISRESFRAFVHKALQSPRVAPHGAHLLAG